jgi:hypothetical protein
VPLWSEGCAVWSSLSLRISVARDFRASEPDPSVEGLHVVPGAWPAQVVMLMVPL